MVKTIYRRFTRQRHHTTMANFKDRFRAAGIHFVASLAIAAAAALLVFGIWFPYPYREISGGRELFTLVVSVDVILGPLITFAIFNRQKSWTELRRDLAIVVAIQLAGLVYGLWTVSMARPVHLVFEIDRFRVIHAVEVPPDMVQMAPADVDPLPLAGPTLLSTRAFRSEAERVAASVAAVRGVPIGSRPDFWQSFEAGRGDVLKIAKPVAALKGRFPDRSGEIERVLQTAGRSESNTLWVPMTGRKAFWTALVDASTGEPVAFVPLDSF